MMSFEGALAERIGNEWDGVLQTVLQSPAYRALKTFLAESYASRAICPPAHQVFDALRRTPPAAVKAVILGQDPYIGPGQAHGLAFSVPPGVPPPPSLRNIYREFADDTGASIPADGCLTEWADRGVLLLNAVLTAEMGRSDSHAGRGWEVVTDEVIRYLGNRDRPTVFVLWGGKAQKKRRLIKNTAHLVLCAPHPSPLSAYRGFFGSRPFSVCNAFLQANGVAPIEWTIADAGEKGN